MLFSIFFNLLLLLFGSFAAVPAASPRFDVDVEGVLKCAEYPAAMVRIRLWKNNEKSVLNETYADKSGQFSLSATSDTANFDPIIVIYHDCNDGVKPGQRKLKFQVPRHYITTGGPDRRRRPFQLGSFNLETVMKYNEERQQYVDRRRRRRGNSMHKSARSDDLRKLEREWHVDNNETNRKHRTRRCDDCEIEEVDVKKHHHKATTSTKKPKKVLFDKEPDDRYDPW